MGRKIPKPPRYCHYCGEKATTRDHIVPRSRIRGLVLEGISNVVPACQTCNNRKSDKRSDCVCWVCTEAWTWYGMFVQGSIEWIELVTEDAVPA